MPLAGQPARRKSPKDWTPPKKARLLTREDRLRIARILDGTEKDTQDVEWLVRKVDMLSRLGPEDYDFPDYLGLVNPIAGNAFALRYSRDRHFRKETLLDAGPMPSTISLLDIDTQCQVCDADLIVRPFVRVASDTPMRMVDELRREQLRMTVDGEEVIAGSIDAHLVGPNGWGIRKIPFSFKPSLGGCLFSGVFLDDQQNALAHQMYGLMAPNGSKITVDLVHCEDILSEPVLLTTGLIAATYTTKAR